MPEFIFTLLPPSHPEKVLLCYVKGTLRKAVKRVIPFRKTVTQRVWMRAIDET